MTQDKERDNDNEKLHGEDPALSDRVNDCINRCKQTNGKCAEDSGDSDKPHKSADTRAWLIERLVNLVTFVIVMLVLAALYAHVVQGRDLEDGLMGPVTTSIAAVLDFILGAAVVE